MANTRYKYTIRWFDTRGYSYAVTATEFINSQELVNALKASTAVKRVCEPEVTEIKSFTPGHSRQRDTVCGEPDCWCAKPKSKNKAVRRA